MSQENIVMSDEGHDERPVLQSHIVAVQDATPSPIRGLRRALGVVHIRWILPKDTSLC